MSQQLFGYDKLVGELMQKIDELTTEKAEMARELAICHLAYMSGPSLHLHNGAVVVDSVFHANQAG